MAEYFGKGISIGSGFDLGANQPLDNRTVQETVADLDAMPTIQLVEGLMVYVKENKTTYILKSFSADGMKREWQILTANGANNKASKADLSRSGEVYVDKIWHNSVCWLPCSSPIGYRIGKAKNQQIVVSVSERSSSAGGYHQINDSIFQKLKTRTDIPSDMVLDINVDFGLKHIEVNSNYNYLLTTNVYKPSNMGGTRHISVYWDRIPLDFHLGHCYIGIICDFLSGGTHPEGSYKHSGYFEMTKEGWEFHEANNIIGNSGTRKVVNGVVVDEKWKKFLKRKIDYNLLRLKYRDYTTVTEFLWDLLDNVYKFFVYKTHHQYFLFAKTNIRKKYRLFRKKDTNNYTKESHPRKWIKICSCLNPNGKSPGSSDTATWDGLGIERFGKLLTENAGLGPFIATNRRLKRLLGRTKYINNIDPENNSVRAIQKFKIINYVDFAIARGGHSGKWSNITFDQYSIKFRIYFRKNYFWVELK